FPPPRLRTGPRPDRRQDLLSRPLRLEREPRALRPARGPVARRRPPVGPRRGDVARAGTAPPGGSPRPPDPPAAPHRGARPPRGRRGARPGRLPPPRPGHRRAEEPP